MLYVVEFRSLAHLLAACDNYRVGYGTAFVNPLSGSTDLLSLVGLELCIQEADPFQTFILLESGGALLLLDKVIVIAGLDYFPIQRHDRPLTSLQDPESVVRRSCFTFQRIAVFTPF